MNYENPLAEGTPNNAVGRQGVPVPGKAGYYVPPGESPYSAKPSLVERFARSVAAHPNYTEDMLAKHLTAYGTDPRLYNAMREYRASGGNVLPQPPARGTAERFADYAGQAVKELSDPIGLAATWYGSPVGIGIRGGVFEGAREHLNQQLRGVEANKRRIAEQAIYGGVGAGVGAKLFSRKPGMLEKQGDRRSLGGVIGRQLGATASGNVLQDAQANTF